MMEQADDDYKRCHDAMTEELERIAFAEALAAALPHLASAQPQPSKSDEERARQLAEELSCFHWPLRGPYPNATRLLLSAIAAARAAALDECEAVARGELWFPDKYNSRYRCEVGNGENKDALNWSMEVDYGKARNAAADRIASLKRGPVAEESGE